MDIKVLEDAGLTNAEAKIYLMLLKSGSSLAGKISRDTGIHRRSVYDAIERLIEKGLVSYIKTNNRKYFQAEDPKRFIDILKEKEDRIKGALPELEGLRSIAQETKETTFYRGKLAIRGIFDDQINEGKEILVLGGSENVNEIMGYYFIHYDLERKKKDIKVKIVFKESVKNSDYLKNLPLADIRFIPDKNSSPLAINIYGDKTAIILWTHEPIGILIKEKAIAEGYRKYFEIVWEGAKK
ncbi:TrmB family transcriptional regulator [candidate division KSB1 bacterium]